MEDFRPPVEKFSTGGKRTRHRRRGRGGLSADEGEDFVAAGFHFGLGFGLEIEADEGFGVGAADIEPPGGVFEAEAVEFQEGSVGEFFAQPAENGGGVGDGGIDFAAGEVAADGGDEAGEGLVGLGEEVGDEKDGEGGGLGEGVFLEVVVAGEFSGEEGVFFAHLGLDESVADAAAVGDAACFLDDFLDGPRGAQVVEDVGAGIGLENGLGDEGGDHVHGNDVAVFVEEADAVGVAVEACGEIEAAGADGLLRVDEGVRIEGVGLVVGEGSVEDVEERGNFEEAVEDLGFEDAHGVGIVDEDAKGAPDVGEGAEVVDVSGDDVEGDDFARGGCGGGEILVADDAFEVEDSGVAGEGDGAGAADFETVPGAGIVGGGDHDGGVGAEELVGVVGHGGGAHAEVDDFGAVEDEAAGKGIEEGFGVGAHVASDDDFFAAEEGENGASDLERHLVGEGFAVDSADVVCLENACHGD